MEKSIRVHILGREYPLKVREEDEALTRKVATYVGERMGSARNDLPNQPDLTVAIITAMSFAEEILTLRKAVEENSSIDEELEKLVQRLDRALAEENMVV